MDTARPVIVGVDGSESALGATRWAAAEATRRHAPLRLVHGYLWPTHDHISAVSPAADLPASVLGRTQAQIDAAAAAAHEVNGELEITSTISADGPQEALVSESRQAQLVVVGSRGFGGFRALLLGSVAIAVAAGAECPIAVVRGEPTPDGPVVVGVDGSPVSEAALAFAFEEASMRGAPLVAVHAWSDFRVPEAFSYRGFAFDIDEIRAEETQVLAARMAGWDAKYPDVQQRRVVAHDGAAHALLELAEQAQLVVVGTHGRGGVSRLLLGSTSHALMHHAPCPVIVVPPDWTG
jgi:nucleotide-binding universal stress UspA family protein